MIKIEMLVIMTCNITMVTFSVMVQVHEIIRWSSLYVLLLHYVIVIVFSPHHIVNAAVMKNTLSRIPTKTLTNEKKNKYYAELQRKLPRIIVTSDFLYRCIVLIGLVWK